MENYMNKKKSFIFISVILLTALLSACASAEVKAAKQGDIKSLQEYINKGGDVNEAQRGGTTLLMYAAEAGQIQAINFLLDNGAIISLKDNTGRTAFIYAVIPGKQAAAELLLQRGGDVNITLSSGDSALTLSASSQNQGMMKMLLDKGAELNHKNNGGWSSLTLSLSKDAQRASGINPASNILIERGAALDLNSANVRKVAFTAAASGNRDILKYLLDKGFKLETKSDKGETLLFTAVSAQKTEMVRFLLDRGADWSVKDSSGWSILMKSLYNSAAAGKGPDTIATLLMEKGARPEANSPQAETTGYKAAETGAIEILNLLFDNGLSYNIRDAKGNSLLIAGIAHTKIIRLLIDKGISVDSRNEQKYTPLIMATAGEHRDSLSLLLQAGAEPDLKDNNGQTALLYAAGSSDVEMVRKLLIAGASPHSTDKSGNTALHKAAVKGTPETMRLLLTAGIYVDSSNAQGETAYILTQKNQKYGAAIRDILAQAGAKVPIVEEQITPAPQTKTEVQPETKKEAVTMVVPVPKPVITDSAQTTQQPSTDQKVLDSIAGSLNTPSSKPNTSSEPVVPEVEPETEEPVPSPKPVPPAEPEPAAQPDLTVRFGWPSINPSSVRGWNNSDKMTGKATLQIAYSSESSWFYEYTMDIPRKGVNADRYEADLDFGSRKLDSCKAVLTIHTKKGNALVSEIIARPDLDGNMILYFDNFKYQK
jgi:uncharacterized protein